MGKPLNTRSMAAVRRVLAWRGAAVPGLPSGKEKRLRGFFIAGFDNDRRGVNRDRGGLLRVGVTAQPGSRLRRDGEPGSALDHRLPPRAARRKEPGSRIKTGSVHEILCLKHECG